MAQQELRVHSRERHFASFFGRLSIALVLVAGLAAESTAGVLSIAASAQGWYDHHDRHDASNSNYFAGYEPSDGTDNANFFVFPLDTLSGRRVDAATLRLNTGAISGSVTYALSAVSTPAATLAAGGTVPGAYQDLACCGEFGSTAITAPNTALTISLGTAAVQQLNTLLGAPVFPALPQPFAVGGSITTPAGGSAFGFTGSEAAVLTLTTREPTVRTSGGQDFGNVLVGTSASAPLRVRNDGDVGTMLYGTVAGNAGVNGFSNAGGAFALPQFASSFQQFTNTVTFAPLQISGPSQIEIVTTTQVGVVRDPFRGSGVAPGNVVTKLDAGATRIGTVREALVTVRNAGNGNLSGLGDSSNLNGTVGTASGAFVGAGGALSLTDGATTSFAYDFAPTEHGSRSATVQLSFANGSDDGRNRAQEKSVVLAGRGVGPSFRASAAPGSVFDFGDVMVGDGVRRTLDIANLTLDLGLADELTRLTLLDAEITGSGAAAFDLGAFLHGTSLAVGESVSLDLGFRGMSPGRFDALLSFYSDQGAALGSRGEVFTFHLTGHAVTESADVPEPGTLALVLLGLAGVARRLRC